MPRSAPTRRRSVFVHHALAAATLAALSGGVQSQTQAQAQAPTPPGQLQTITISAERRVENIREVPVSASVLQGEILEVLNTSGMDVRMLSGRVPSLNIESSFGRAFPRFYIRGYGNTDFRLNASQPVSLVYDDVVQESPILKGFPAFDLENIEVLRGPQGSLFGRNTPAGVVKFESVKPGKTAEGYGSISVGTFSTVNLEGAATMPLSDTMSARISVLNQTRSDWVENTFDAGLTQDLEGYRDSAFESKLQVLGGNARLKWALGSGMTLHSVTGLETLETLNRGDIDGGFGASFLPSSGPGFIPFASETADGIPEHSQFTQELRLESDSSGALSWQAGVYLFKEDYKVESFSFDSTAASAQDGYQRIKQTNDAYAVFGALNYQVSPALKLRGGLRYTIDNKELNVEAYEASGFAPCIGPTIGAIPPPVRCTLADLLAAEGPGGSLSASPEDKKFNWDISGTYALNKDVSLYARAATGFRGSSVQSASAFNSKSVAGPETATSVEAGVKADLFDRRARVAFNVFNYTVKDLQLTAVGGAANANILLNAEKATGRGFELDMQALLSDNLLATFGLGYNDTKLKDPGLAVSVCAACTVTDPRTAGGQALIDGNPLPQAPKSTDHCTLKSTPPLGNGEMYVFTDWVHRSKVNFFLYESVEFTGKALTEGGLRLGYTWAAGKYDAAIFGRNITNQMRIVGGIDFNNLTGFINEPRTVGVSFRANF